MFVMTTYLKLLNIDSNLPALHALAANPGGEVDWSWSGGVHSIGDGASTGPLVHVLCAALVKAALVLQLIHIGPARAPNNQEKLS